MEVHSVSSAEAKELKAWYEGIRGDVPANIKSILDKVVPFVEGFSEATHRSKDMLVYLRQLMGITPKSESGSSLTKR